jgi:hypothetical protein
MNSYLRLVLIIEASLEKNMNFLKMSLDKLINNGSIKAFRFLKIF